jgi:hypothetical protein
MNKAECNWQSMCSCREPNERSLRSSMRILDVVSMKSRS